MTSSNAQVLISARLRSGDTGMSLIEEYFRHSAQRIRSRLVSRCSGDFDVELVSIQIQPAGEIPKAEAFAETGVTNLIQFDHLPVTTAVVVQRRLLTRIIGLMLGDEESDEEEEEAFDRTLSPVEIRIATRVFDDIVGELVASWPASPAPSISLCGTPSSLRNTKLRPERGDVYTALFEVGLDEEHFGSLLVALPTELVRKLTRLQRDMSEGQVLKPKVDLTGVMDVGVEVVAELGRPQMTLQQLRSLAVGDVLPLGASTDVVVRVNGREILRCEAGQRDGQRSVRVIRGLV